MTTQVLNRMTTGGPKAARLPPQNFGTSWPISLLAVECYSAVDRVKRGDWDINCQRLDELIEAGIAGVMSDNGPC